MWIKLLLQTLESANELTRGGAHAKQAVSPGISNCMWPETASSETPVQEFLSCQLLVTQNKIRGKSSDCKVYTNLMCAYSIQFL